jgi:hypothetical protein
MTSCGPVDAELCGDQGAIIAAAAYLDAHYQPNPSSCNSQVVIPWVWLVRFAAELALQSATKAIYLATDGNLDAWPLTKRHDFKTLHEVWVAALVRTAKDSGEKESLKSSCRLLKCHYESIDDLDKGGLSLRYPVSHPKKPVSQLTSGFVEHCDWPVSLRLLIVGVCDLTIACLPHGRIQCRNAFGFLRATAAAARCLGDYVPTRNVFDEDWKWACYLEFFDQIADHSWYPA